MYLRRIIISMGNVQKKFFFSYLVAEFIDIVWYPFCFWRFFVFFFINISIVLMTFVELDTRSNCCVQQPLGWDTTGGRRYDLPVFKRK